MELVVFPADGGDFEHVPHQMTSLLHVSGHLEPLSGAVVHDGRVRFADSKEGVASQSGQGHQLRIDGVDGFFLELEIIT